MTINNHLNASSQDNMSGEDKSSPIATSSPVRHSEIELIIAKLPDWMRSPILGVVLSLVCTSPVVALIIPASRSFVQPPVQHQSVSRIDYELLKKGMTLTDAQATLGRAIEVSRDETTITYEWSNRDGSEITAVFKDNQLIRKKQSGLK